MYSKTINYAYSIVFGTSEKLGYLGSSIGSISYNVISSIASVVNKSEENPLLDSQIANTANTANTANAENDKDIQMVIHDYKRVQTRYQANKQIIHIDEKYIENIDDNIKHLSDINKDLDDEYINGWVEILTQRKKVLCSDLEILLNSQKAFKEFSVKEETHNMETLTLCNICMENKKDRSLDCGHVFCDLCLNKLSNCPTCRMHIDRNKIRPVFI